MYRLMINDSRNQILMKYEQLKYDLEMKYME